jgi:hypothetical protein
LLAVHFSDRFAVASALIQVAAAYCAALDSDQRRPRRPGRRSTHRRVCFQLVGNAPGVQGWPVTLMAMRRIRSGRSCH